MAGKDMILVVCDRLSKISHFLATIEEILAEDLVKLFKDNVWELYGLPGSVISNKMLGIEMRLSTVFHL